MPLTTITRKLEWDAGHRVLGHEGKCRHLHGHRYVAELTVTAPDLDKLGRVIDFSVLKSVVGKWIDDTWDHGFLCHPNDPLARLWRTETIDKTEHLRGNDAANPVKYELVTHLYSTGIRKELFGGKAPYVMKSGNPTAENIACELFNKATELLTPHGITVVRVRCTETPNCWAEYTGGPVYPTAQDLYDS